MAILTSVTPLIPVLSPALDTPMPPRAQADAAKSNAYAPGFDDPMWHRGDIDSARWSQTYPYQLLVVEASPGSAGATIYRPVPGWKFTLPMPPEAITIERSYASTISAQSLGVLEEHNGLVFVPIQIHGTCGVLPLRGAADQQPGANPLQSIAAGTVTAIAGLTDAAATLQRTVTQSPMVNGNAHAISEFAGTALGKSTGYYQTRLMADFLDAYARMKMDRRYRARVLAFCAWKDEAVWLVKPLSFRMSKSAASPLEWTYDVPMTAWARVVLDAGSSGPTAPPTPIRHDPGLLALVLNSVQAARAVVAGVSNVATAVLGDIDRLLTEPMRETALFCKQVQGARLTVWDLPRSIVQQTTASFAASAAQAAGFPDEQDDEARTDLRAAAQAGVELGATSRLTARPGGPDPALDHPVVNVGPGALDAVGVDDMVLSPDMAARIKAEVDRCAALTSEDFAQRRDKVRAASDRLAASLGAGSASYDALYDLPPIAAVKPEPSDADWEVLFALADAAAAMDRLAATADPPTTAGPMDATAALAAQSDIPFQVPGSKFAVPYRHGVGLERMAQIYLGDPQRWLEIAVLNGLQPPYVDETGWSVSLAVNGADSEISVIAETAPDLYAGQTVYLRSRTTGRVSRKVEALKSAGDLLTVALSADASAYVVADGAVLEGFLPHTVNSQQMVYIPSSEVPIDDSVLTRSIPGIGEFDPLVAAGGVDLLLDDKYEIVFTEDGDTPLAAGLQSLIQSWRVDLATPLGSAILRPGDGRKQIVGRSTSEVSTTDQLREIQKMFDSDPAVESVAGLTVSLSAPANRIAMAIKVRGVRQPIPVNYDVDTGFDLPDPT